MNSSPLWFCTIVTMCGMLGTLIAVTRARADMRKTRADLVLVRRRLDSVTKLVEERTAEHAAKRAEKAVERLRPATDTGKGLFHLSGYHATGGVAPRGMR